MYTLLIDTHDKNVVLIVYKDGKVFKMKNELSQNKHSEITMPLLDELLKCYCYNLFGWELNEL